MASINLNRPDGEEGPTDVEKENRRKEGRKREIVIYMKIKMKMEIVEYIATDTQE